MQKHVVQFATLGLLCVLWARGSPAADEPKDPGLKPDAPKVAGTAKAPSAASVLQKVVKSLAKVKGYRAKVDVLGGFATSGDHEVTDVKVRESFQGDIVGELMQSKDPKTIRTSKKGAAYVDGNWRDIFSDRGTVKMARLFAFPKDLLDKAALNATRGARWLNAAPASTEADQGKEEPEAKTSKPVEGKKGTTAVVKGKDAKTTDVAVKLPTIIRVEIPPEEALAQFITVQNSNCFGGG